MRDVFRGCKDAPLYPICHMTNPSRGLLLLKAHKIWCKFLVCRLAKIATSCISLLVRRRLNRRGQAPRSTKLRSFIPPQPMVARVFDIRANLGIAPLL
jgi:hypothetical protein